MRSNTSFQKILKKSLICFLTCIFVIITTCAFADAPYGYYEDDYYDGYNGDYSYVNAYERPYFTPYGEYDDQYSYFDSFGKEYDVFYGFVICTNLNVRVTPKSNAKKLATLHNNDVIRIVEVLDDWYGIDLGYSNIKSDAGIGYVHSAFVANSPKALVLEGRPVSLYSTPWDGGSIIQTNGDLEYLVISETNSWYCVQLSKGKAGSAFIRKTTPRTYNGGQRYPGPRRPRNHDFGFTTTNQDAWIILTKYTTLYTDPWNSGMKNGEKSADTLLKVVAENSDYYAVSITSSGATAFIRKKDVSIYGEGNAYYVKESCRIHDSYTGDTLYKLSKGDIVWIEGISRNSDKLYITFDTSDGEQISGYVNRKHVNRILN